MANLGTAIGNGMVPAAQTGGSSVNITSGVSQLTGSVARQNFIAQNFDSTDSQVYAMYVRNTDQQMLQPFMRECNGAKFIKRNALPLVPSYLPHHSTWLQKF